MSIASLLFVALFTVNAIDAYIIILYPLNVSATEEPPVCSVPLSLDLNWEWEL